MLKSVAFISSGLHRNNFRLQPWRYLSEAAIQLQQLGHPVTLIGDEEANIPELAGISVQRLATASNPKWKANQALSKTVRQVNPDVIVWHVGLTSFLHQNFELGLAKPAVGIFTSPFYQAKELMRLGVGKLLAGYCLSSMAVIGSLLPMPLLRARMSRASLEVLVVQTETTCRDLKERRLWQRPLQVIPPGVDKVWLDDLSRNAEEVRRAYGYSREDTVVVYFGPPAPLRGLPTLLKAFELAQRTDKSLKLLVLSRKRNGEAGFEQLRDPRRRNHKDARSVQVVEDVLWPDEMASYVAASDVAALPFELAPSDAPLSLLEARALGKPLVTTRVACLPELAGAGAHLARPGDPAGLAQALLQAAQEARQPKEKANHHGDPKSIVGWEQVGEIWSQLVQSL
jgi:glycosyltransferase involved in cell wall biosynthesis